MTALHTQLIIFTLLDAPLTVFYMKIMLQQTVLPTPFSKTLSMSLFCHRIYPHHFCAVYIFHNPFSLNSKANLFLQCVPI